MRIREYRPGDRDAVVTLWQAAGLLVNPLNDPDRDIAFCFDSGHGTVLVGEADDGGVLQCAAMVGHDGHRGWVYYVATDPAARRAGHGRTIMAACEDWLRRRGVPKVELMVRASNTTVIGFYQRLGYMPEPVQVMSRRLDGVAVPAGGQRSDERVIVTYLEMTERPELPRIEPVGRKLALLRADRPTVSFYRYLYDAVGRDWWWTDRKILSDADLEAIIHDPAVDVMVLYVDGSPAGFFELDRRAMPMIELAYFGIAGPFVGQRLGPFLLAEAVEQAWSHGPERLTVNTCTLDHPRALGLYQRFGFRPYDRREVTPPWLGAVGEVAAG